MPGPKPSPRTDRAAKLIVDHPQLTAAEAMRRIMFSATECADKHKQNMISKKKRRLLSKSAAAVPTPCASISLTCPNYGILLSGQAGDADAINGHSAEEGI